MIAATVNWWVRAGEILGVVGVCATVLLWVGVLSHRVEATEKAQEATPSVVADVAVLKSQVAEMKTQLGEIKSAQATQEAKAAERQQEILNELRKRQ